MKVKFLPKEWLFWACHIGGWLCVSVPFVHLDVTQLDAVLHGTGAMDGANYSWQTELLRFLLTIPVLLWYRYLFVAHSWRQLVPVELISLTLGFNLLFAVLFAYFLPYHIPTTEWWFEWFQKESSGTSRNFDEKVISFVYSYCAQVLWCFFYVMFRTLKMNKSFEVKQMAMKGQLKSAKITTLSSQISPHFLFNAMNNICSLMDEDVQKAQAALRAFSDVLRFSLNDSMNQTIPIKEELELVRNYIEVVGIQYEDKLIFQQDVPLSVMHFGIPPMTIQLLVENAVKHGISQRKKGGEVLVSIEDETLGMRLRVENSGVIKENTSQKRKPVGIQNIKERLMLVYGARASFKLFEHEEDDEKVVAEILLPKRHCM